MSTPEPSPMPADDAEAVSRRATERKEKRADRRTTFLGLVLATASTLVVTLLTTYFNLHAASNTQQALFAENRSAADRASKKDAYLTFLDAANNYAYAAVSARSCINAGASAASTPPNIATSCTAQIMALGADRFAFQAARNGVFYFGSHSAETQAGLIAGYLPPALGGDPLTGLPPLDSALAKLDLATFKEMYQRFEDTVRCEVTATPRTGC